MSALRTSGALGRHGSHQTRPRSVVSAAVRVGGAAPKAPTPPPVQFDIDINNESEIKGKDVRKRVSMVSLGCPKNTVSCLHVGHTLSA